MEQPIQPWTFGEMFERVFRLLGRTFTRNSLIGFLVLLPGALLLVFSLSSFAGALSDVIRDLDPSATPSDDEVLSMFWSMLTPLFGTLILLFVAVTLYAIGSLLASLAMARVSASTLEGIHVEWSEALGAVAGVVLLRGLGQSLLLACLIVGILIGPYILLFLGIDALVLAGVFGIVGAIPVIIWLSIRWQFAQIVIAVEEDTVLHSFQRSAYLVREWWWRTFGITIGFAIVAGIAVQIIMMPLGLVGMFAFSASFADVFVSSNMGDTPSPEAIVSVIRTIGIAYIAFITLASIASQMFASNYLVVMYYDLRARKGEFASPLREGPPQQGLADNTIMSLD